MKKVDFIKEIAKECNISITQATKFYYNAIEKDADETIINAMRIISVDESKIKMGLTDEAKKCVAPFTEIMKLKYGKDNMQTMMKLYYEMHVNFMKLVLENSDDMTLEEMGKFELKLHEDAKLSESDKMIQDIIKIALIGLIMKCDLSVVAAESILSKVVDAYILEA